METVCEKEHRYMRVLEKVPPSQAQPGRHKCAGCAYDQGLQDGMRGRKMHLDARTLHDSQAGTGRHKDVHVAYAMGYVDGLRQ